MRIQLDFVENGCICTREKPEDGKNPSEKEILVFEQLTMVFDYISDSVAENNANKA